jgi:hypothetical protein
VALYRNECSPLNSRKLYHFVLEVVVQEGRFQPSEELLQRPHRHQTNDGVRVEIDESNFKESIPTESNAVILEVGELVSVGEAPQEEFHVVALLV